MEKNKAYWINQSKSFDQAAEYYDRYRPSYPEQLVNDIIARSKVDQTSEILEIGAGSGKATEQFIRKGLHFTCIEPGVNLAQAGVHKFKDTKQVNYIISRFEDWEEVQEYYDLIISAQAFHWVQKPLGYIKSANVLKENGSLALFWNFYLSSDQALDKALQDFFIEYPMIHFATQDSIEKMIQHNLNEIRDCNRFAGVEVIRYPWSEECSIEDYIGFIKTGNTYLTLDDASQLFVENKITEIINHHGGSIVRNYVCTLFLAKKACV